MAEYRRKKLFIDTLFQGKFLLLFLFMGFLSCMGNYLYLSRYLKKEVEENLYRARFVITNLNDIIVDNIISFNAGLLILITVLAVICYFLVRKRITLFLDGLTNALLTRKSGGPPATFEFSLPREFMEINDVLADFFGGVDRRLTAEHEALTLLENFLAAPDETTKQEVLDKLLRL